MLKVHILSAIRLSYGREVKRGVIIFKRPKMYRDWVPVEVVKMTKQMSTDKVSAREKATPPESFDG